MIAASCACASDQIITYHGSQKRMGKAMNNLRGLKDLLPFLNFLKEKGVWYIIQHLRHDAIMVTITLLGERVEIEFFDDHIEYSRFTGDEGVERDPAVVFALIEEFVRE